MSIGKIQVESGYAYETGNYGIEVTRYVYDRMRIFEDRPRWDGRYEYSVEEISPYKDSRDNIAYIIVEHIFIEDMKDKNRVKYFENFMVEKYGYM